MKEIKTTKAPEAVGPYSQAIVAGDFIFCSGQIGLDPETQQLVEGLESQTRQVLQNLTAVLEASSLSLANVVRTDIFIKNIADFQKVNAIYEEFFSTKPQPARQTVEVSNLPKGALIEISAIAYKKV